MWIRKYGEGKVFFSNTTLFQGKIFRGVMKQLIAYVEDVTFFPILNFSEYSLIILAVENYSGLLKENFLGIKEWVEKGGNLFISQRSYRSPFNQMAGIEKIGEFIETKSFNLKKDIFPGLKDLKPGSIIFF